MPRTDRTMMEKATNGSLPKGLKRCTKCSVVKTTDCFYPQKADRGRQPRLDSWCKTCRRLANTQYRQTPAGKESQKKRNAKPEVKKKKLERNRTAAYREKRACRCQTAKYRLMAARGAAKRRLRDAADPDKREKLSKLIALYDSELNKIRHR